MPSPTSTPPSSNGQRRRYGLVIAILVGTLAGGAVIAQLQGQPSASAHPLPPPGHTHPTPTTRPPTATRPPICSPPNACYPPPTTSQRPPPTTTRRPIIIFPPCFPNCGPPPPTTTAAPPPTTTRRPIIIFPPCFPNCGQPPPTTTTAPPPTTTQRPPTTTSQRPPPTTQRVTIPSCTWACNEIGSGVQNGYLPSNFDHEADTEGTDLQEIIEDYHEYNNEFNRDAALVAIPEGETDRGDMFNVLALGLGLIDEPADDPFELADELADLAILYGHDRDGDGVTNPYSRPDADPDSTMTNSQLAAFLDRIPINNGNNAGGPTVGDPGDNPGGPTVGDPGDNPLPDPETPPCSTGLLLTSGLRVSFLSDLRWTTLVDIRANGPPGEPWPPHPGVPGGSEYLVVAKSPVWPSVDPQAHWHVSSLDGCLWETVSVRTLLSQLVPWRSEHRALIENEAAARPRAGFDTYLNRWDNLSATQQSQAQQYHLFRSVHASCDFADTLDPSLAESRCSWELPWAGVWDWTVSACFEGWTQDRTYHECAVLDHGVEWFLSVLDYTQQITLLGGERAGG